jgi:K+-sensing histidine kinase KdpD
VAQGLRQTAEEARAAKQQFVANVSHELRTPLNMIIGFSEMILGSPRSYGRRIPGALLADLAVIQRNATHLSELVDDVLDMSQIEADQMALAKEHVAFAEIVEAAATAVRPLFDSKGLYLQTEIQDDLPLVFCDPTRMREVMLEPAEQRGRFTEEGGQVRHVERARRYGWMCRIPVPASLRRISAALPAVQPGRRLRSGAATAARTRAQHHQALHRAKYDGDPGSEHAGAGTTSPS